MEEIKDKIIDRYKYEKMKFINEFILELEENEENKKNENLNQVLEPFLKELDDYELIAFTKKY